MEISWEDGLTREESDRARKLLAPKFSILELFKRYSREVVPTGGGTWTHKCVCINQEHKQGNERSPSCSFNEDEQTFFCFGCRWGGDVFDVMAKLQNRATDQLIEELVKKNGVDVDQDLPPLRPKLDLARINQKMSVMLREHLDLFRNTDCYEEEMVWVDGMFRKIDERLAWLEATDVEEARALYEGICMNLERRKLSSIQECF